MDDIVLFNECSLENIATVGKKAAFLSELYSKGFNVPEGFIITGNLFVKFVELTGIKQNVAEVLVSSEDKEKKALKIQQIILNTYFPEDMADFIYKSYMKMGDGEREPFVSLKVSSTSDYVEDSFFLNISGKERLINGIKSCWASVFSENNIDLKRFKPSVIIQKMINPVKSGYVYSRNPINASSEEVLVQVCSGLGNSISLSQTLPSGYIVKKSDSAILGSDLKEQKIQYNLSMEKRRTFKNEMQEPMKNVLDEHVLRELAKIVSRAEERVNDPIRISFAIDKNIQIVSARPIDVRDFKRRFDAKYNIEQPESKRDQEQSYGQDVTAQQYPGNDHREQGPQQQAMQWGNQWNYQNQQQTDQANPRSHEEQEINQGEQQKPDHQKNESQNHQSVDYNPRNMNQAPQQNSQYSEEEPDMLQYYQPEVHHNGPQEETRDSQEETRIDDHQYQHNSNDSMTQNQQNISQSDSSQNYQNNPENSKPQYKESRDSFVSKHMPEDPGVLFSKSKFVNQMNLINSDMVVTSVLRKRFRSIFSRDPPSSRDALLSELKTRTQIPYENEIQRVRALRDEFINNLKEPEESDVKFAMDVISRLVNEF